MTVTSLLGALAAMAIVAGGLLVVAGLRKSPPRPDADGPTRKRTPARAGRFTSRVRRRAAVGLGVGVLLWLLTGYFVAVLITPLALLILPTLVAASPQAGVIERIEGIETWTRSLTGVLDVGVGLEEAIVSASLRATPPAIEKEVRLLVARIRARSDLPTALRAFSVDLDDATGEIMVVALISGATQRGKGLVDTLETMADTVSEEVRIRRTVEAERAPGRTATRTVTIFSVVFLAALFTLTDFMAPYSSPLGQVLLGFFLVAFLLSLQWMQSLSKTKPLPRIIGDDLRTRPRRSLGAIR